MVVRAAAMVSAWPGGRVSRRWRMVWMRVAAVWRRRVVAGEEGVWARNRPWAEAAVMRFVAKVRVASGRVVSRVCMSGMGCGIGGSAEYALYFSGVGVDAPFVALFGGEAEAYDGCGAVGVDDFFDLCVAVGVACAYDYDCFAGAGCEVAEWVEVVVGGEYSDGCLESAHLCGWDGCVGGCG